MPTFGLAQLDLLAQKSTVEHTAVKQDLSHHSVSEDKDPQTPQAVCVRPVSLLKEILSYSLNPSVTELHRFVGQ